MSLACRRGWYEPHPQPGLAEIIRDCCVQGTTTYSTFWGFDIQKSIVDAVVKSRKLGRSVDADLLVNKSKVAGYSEKFRGVMPHFPAVRPAEMRCGHGGSGPALRVLAKMIKTAVHQYESGLQAL